MIAAILLIIGVILFVACIAAWWLSKSWERNDFQ